MVEACVYTFRKRHILLISLSHHPTSVKLCYIITRKFVAPRLVYMPRWEVAAWIGLSLVDLFSHRDPRQLSFNDKVIHVLQFHRLRTQ